MARIQALALIFASLLALVSASCTSVWHQDLDFTANPDCDQPLQPFASAHALRTAQSSRWGPRESHLVLRRIRSSVFPFFPSRIPPAPLPQTNQPTIKV